MKNTFSFYRKNTNKVCLSTYRYINNCDNTCENNDNNVNRATQVII